jgi:hypothetical protein
LREQLRPREHGRRAEQMLVGEQLGGAVEIEARLETGSDERL